MEIPSLNLWFITVNVAFWSVSTGHVVYRGSNNVVGHRERRAVGSDPRANCNSWSQWTNTHTPSSSDPMDIEHVSPHDVHTFCPPLYGGTASKIMCRDQRGEPFHGNQTDRTSGHTISCESPTVGAVCKLLPGSKVDKCPDLSIQYYCSCSDTTIAVTTPTTTPTTSTTTTTKIPTTVSTSKPVSSIVTKKTAMSSPTTKNARQISSDGVTISEVVTLLPIKKTRYEQGTVAVTIVGLLVPWWVVMLVTTLTLFSVSTCITVCLYKHLKNKLRDKLRDKQRTKVSPISPLDTF